MNYCSNCGAKVKPGASFCRSCGANLPLEENNNLNSKIFASNNDDTLIDAYIGKNSDEIKVEKFSIYSFLFRSSYFVYRKMWLLFGIRLLLIILLIVLLDLFDFGTPLDVFNIVVIFNIVVACNFRKIYLNHVKRKVKRIKLKNSDKSMEELKKICSKKGGTNLIFAMIVVFFHLFIISKILHSFLMPICCK